MSTLIEIAEAVENLQYNAVKPASRVRRVINGLEGCGKSSDNFIKLQKVTTPNNPVIFAFKNYKLMKEQIKNWSERFSEPVSSFAICGMNKDYEEALKSYTNQKSPWLVPKTAKFIFISQALLQRNKIKDLSWERKLKGLGNPVVSHVVIDEFDFSIGVVPNLDYILNHCPNEKIKANLSDDICDFLLKNYTKEDIYRFQESEASGRKFNLAYWIDALECDITVLTSEILATIFLQIIGFEVIDFGEKSFVYSCTMHVCPDPNIGRNFFSKMNINMAWNKLGFKTIISDCIASGYKDTNSLSIDDVELPSEQGMNNEPEIEKLEIINHTSARGSNAFRGKDILTVVSYIPKSKIEEIKDCINCFCKLREEAKYPFFTYNEVESLYYRDRLMQAVGRVIGYRGSKETHVLIHSDIFNQIGALSAFDLSTYNWVKGAFTSEQYENLLKECKIKFNELILQRIIKGIFLVPYAIQPWFFDFPGKADIWDKIREADERSKKTGIERKLNFLHNRKATTLKNLRHYFIEDPNSEIGYKEVNGIIYKNDVKSIAGKGMLQPKKVANFFGLKVKRVFDKGYFIVGLRAK